MLTAPDTWSNRVNLFRFLKEKDSHKWLVGYETGKGGYKHIQARFNVSMGKDDAFLCLKMLIPQAHLEECSDVWDYEAKGGVFVSSDDTKEMRQTRFGVPNFQQRCWLAECHNNNDREVTVVYDPAGSHGKSWLCNHLFETRTGFIVPPTIDTVKGMMQWIASGYKGETYLVIDIPRTLKWSDELYIAIESIKDGLVYDTRYNARMRNIRGVKVLIFTNTRPRIDALSKDRWVILNTEDDLEPDDSHFPTYKTWKRWQEERLRRSEPLT